MNMVKLKNNSVTPFVKWAGGKHQIMNRLLEHVPKDFDRYFEPFIGGGALLFELQPEKATINDYNLELINTYECIKDSRKLELMLSKLDEYTGLHNDDFYYQIRDLDKDRDAFDKIPDYERAARTIYLNKACFNGLYRVNSKNEFNVPSGHKNTIKPYLKENIEGIHEYLSNNNIQIINGDFEQAVKKAKYGDFVYFDPPYDSDSETFNDYTMDGFGRKEQIRLANLYNRLDDNHVKVMLSNHNTKLINELYKGYNIYIVKARRNINSKASGRGAVEEVIITNY